MAVMQVRRLTSSVVEPTLLTGTGEGFALTSRDYAYLSVAEGTKGSANSRNLYAMTSYFGKVNYNYSDESKLFFIETIVWLGVE